MHDPSDPLGSWRLWYTAFITCNDKTRDVEGHYVNCGGGRREIGMLTANSTDGIHWVKPAMDLQCYVPGLGAAANCSLPDAVKTNIVMPGVIGMWVYFYVGMRICIVSMHTHTHTYIYKYPLNLQEHFLVLILLMNDVRYTTWCREGTSVFLDAHETNKSKRLKVVGAGVLQHANPGQWPNGGGVCAGSDGLHFPDCVAFDNIANVYVHSSFILLSFFFLSSSSSSSSHFKIVGGTGRDH